MKCMGEEGAIVCGGRDCMTTPVLGLVAQSISIFPIEGVRDKPNERQIFVPLSESICTAKFSRTVDFKHACVFSSLLFNLILDSKTILHVVFFKESRVKQVVTQGRVHHD